RGAHVRDVLLRYYSGVLLGLVMLDRLKVPVEPLPEPTSNGSTNGTPLSDTITDWSQLQVVSERSRCSPKVPAEVGWPAGHFYSPIPSLEEVERREEEIFRVPRQLPGIDLNEEGQLRLVSELSQFYSDLPFADRGGLTEYHYDNPNFRHGEAVILFCLLRL